MSSVRLLCVASLSISDVEHFTAYSAYTKWSQNHRNAANGPPVLHGKVLDIVCNQLIRLVWGCMLCISATIWQLHLLQDHHGNTYGSYVCYSITMATNMVAISAAVSPWQQYGSYSVAVPLWQQYGTPICCSITMATNMAVISVAVSPCNNTVALSAAASSWQQFLPCQL